MDGKNYKDAVKEMLSESGLKQKHLAAMLGYKSQAAVGNIMSRPDITLNTMLRICDALDYTMVLQPKRSKIVARGVKVVRAEQIEKGDAE